MTTPVEPKEADILCKRKAPFAINRDRLSFVILNAAKIFDIR